MTARVQDNGLARITLALAALSWWFQWGSASGKAKNANAVTTAGTTEARTACVAAQGTTTVANDNLTLTGTIVALATVAITELGTFDAAGAGGPAAGGNMDQYIDFAVVNIGAGDSITFMLKTTFV